ncbi:MAG: LLM class flavin-dependent oxidoreductase [Haloarculaceae archaeon]
MTDELSIGVVLLTEHPTDGSAIRDRDEIAETARLAESLGFDSLWVGEHHFTDRIYFDNLGILSYLAAVTDSIRLGTSICLVPLHNPAMLAERTATLDVLSDGRFTFGVAAGYREAEFEVAGVDHSRRGDRLDEAFDVVEALWERDGVDYEGEEFRFEDVSVNPKPVQEGGPPVWVGGTGPRPVRRAASRGDAWFVDPRVSVPKLERPADYYDERLEAHGREPEERPIWREVFVAETTEEAIETARPYLIEKYDTYLSWGAEEGVGGDSVDAVFEDLASDRFILGSPEAVVEGIERYRREFGMDHLVLRSRWPGMPAETERGSLRLFAEEVMPRFE